MQILYSTVSKKKKLKIKFHQNQYIMVEKHCPNFLTHPSPKANKNKVNYKTIGNQKFQSVNCLSKN